MSGNNNRSNKTVERSIWTATGIAATPFIGCFMTIVLTVVVILSAAGSILGWLFGGGAPSGQADKNKPPAGQVNLWTPTPIPNTCFITPTPQTRRITVPPATPGGTPGEKDEYIPTPTPCPPPRDNWATPDPAWTPAPPGYGPRGAPYKSSYVITQAYGCTEWDAYGYNAACAKATDGVKRSFHRGMDMVGLQKTIYATLDGKIAYAGWGDDGFGNRVYIRSGEFLVIYAHLSQVLVSPGQTIAWGQPIGIEGSTGFSTGSHLHNELHINGSWVDITPYIYR